MEQAKDVLLKSGREQAVSQPVLKYSKEYEQNRASLRKRSCFSEIGVIDDEDFYEKAKELDLAELLTNTMNVLDTLIRLQEEPVPHTLTDEQRTRLLFHINWYVDALEIYLHLIADKKELFLQEKTTTFLDKRILQIDLDMIKYACSRLCHEREEEYQ